MNNKILSNAYYTLGLLEDTREEKMWASPWRNFSVYLKRQNKGTYTHIKHQPRGPAAPREQRRSLRGAGLHVSIDSAIRRPRTQMGLDSLLFTAIRTFWSRFPEPQF